MATGWNPRDSADNQSEIKEITKGIKDVEAQVRKAEAAAEQATQDRNAVRARLREIAKKMLQLDLSEQERAALVAEQQLCVADLTAAEKDLEQLRKKEEQLRQEKLQQYAVAAGLGVGSAPGAGSLLAAAGAAAGVGTTRAGYAGAAADLGVGSAAGTGGLETSTEFIKDVLLTRTVTVADLLDNAQPLARVLDQPLGAKLPVLRGLVPVDVALTDSELRRYVETQPLDQLAAGAHRLRLHVTYALCGGYNQPEGSEIMTTIRLGSLVDTTLSLAASSLGMAFRIDRNSADEFGATARQLRPDFLFWVQNILLFKGEEKAEAADLQIAISELHEKMATSWSPALLPGVSLPCMFAYAAAGNLVQFFVITSRGSAAEVAAVSNCLDTNTPLGRIKVVHHTLKVLQAAAAYAPHAPHIPIALGNVATERTSDGRFLSNVTVFPDFVRKRVNLARLSGGVLDSMALAAMYGAIGRACCPNLVRLRRGGGVHVEEDGTTVRLHLEPLGLPLGRYGGQATQSEADLRLAVGGVLTGLAVLHEAGYVHRDIRWCNVIRLPAVAVAASSSSSSPADTYVLIDLEHAAPADCPVDCRQPPYRLPVWPPAAPLLDPASGRYTRESDLCLVAAELMSYPSFALSESGQHLRQQLATRQLPSARAALEHAWLQAAAAVPQG